MEDLTEAYANAAHIPGAELFPPRWRALAAAFRASLGGRARLDLRYGLAERNRFDLFLPEGGARPRGLVVFIHGGYWRAFGREDWSHLAAGPLARGWAVAMPSYTLAPDARIAAITAEMARAVTAAAAEVPDGPLVVTGHSAGGHLAARLACADTDLPAQLAARLLRAVPISPLADLAPLMRTALNEDLRLDDDEARAESPALRQRRPHVSVQVWVGADERPAFLEQARLLGRAWAVPVTVQAGRHHFDVIDGLADADGALCAAVTGADAGASAPDRG